MNLLVSTGIMPNFESYYIKLKVDNFNSWHKYPVSTGPPYFKYCYHENENLVALSSWLDLRFEWWVTKKGTQQQEVVYFMKMLIKFNEILSFKIFKVRK